MTKNYLKTVKAIICAAIMAISTVSANTIAYPDISTSEYKESIQNLTELDIVSGDEMGLFNPEENLIRAEAAKILLLMKNIDRSIFDYILQGDNASEYTWGITWTDIDKEHWGFPYVILAFHEFLTGFPDDTVRPDEKVTYEQFLTMIVRRLGYGTQAELQGGYPNGFLTVADTLNITQNIEITDAKLPITREEVAHIVALALDVPICEITGYYYDAEANQMVPDFKICDGSNGTELKTFNSQHWKALDIK